MKISCLPWLAIVAVLAGLVLAAGCGGPVAEVDKPEAEQVFAIYLLEENPPAAEPGQPLGDLDELELLDEPWLTAEDMDFYDYATHCIYLKDEVLPIAARFPSAHVSAFVLVAGGERCYLGYFISPVSSYLPAAPYIMAAPTFSFYPEDILAIYYRPVQDAPADVRRDARIHDALSAAGKLHEGLSVALSDVTIVSRQAGETTLSYTFTVTNQDDEAVYVPDPDRMGSALFHYYTNGVYLSPGENTPSISASGKTVTAPAPYGSWEAAWFTRLGGGETMTRTVVLGGYPEIMPGTYRCQFTYRGPSRIAKSERTLPDGQLWLGGIPAAEYELVVSD